MIIKYKAELYYPYCEIYRLEIEKETDHFIYMKSSGRREAKDCDYHAYFDTWKEAHEHIKKVASSRVKKAEAAWQSEKSILKKVNAMREPVL